MTPEEIVEAREKLTKLTDKFSAADFRRVATKFFTALVATEINFERRFPKEYAEWSKEYYGEE